MAGYWGALPRAARLLLAALLVDFVGAGLTHAFLIVYLHQVRGISLGVAGLLVGLNALASFVISFPAGALIDRFGPRVLIVAAQPLIVVGTIVLAFASTVPLAATALVLSGITYGVSWSAFPSLAASVVPSELRQRYFGLEFALVNLGIGAGSIVGSFVVIVDRVSSFQLIYLIDAATFVAPLALLLWPLRQVGNRPAHEAAQTSDGTSARYREVIRLPAVALLFAFSLLTGLVGYAQINSGMVAFATTVAGVSTRWIGVAFAVNTGVIVALQLILLPLLEGRQRTRALAVMGIVWSVAWLCLGGAGLSSGTPVAVALVIACASVFAVGETILAPTIPAIMNDLADDRTRGRVLALNAAGAQSASVIGPPLAGAMIGAGLSWIYITLLVFGSLGCSVLAITGIARRLPAHANGL